MNLKSGIEALGTVVLPNHYWSSKWPETVAVFIIALVALLIVMVMVRKTKSNRHQR